MGTSIVHVVTYFHSLWHLAALNHIMAALADYGLVISAIAVVSGFARRRPSGLIPWLAGGAAIAATLVALAGLLAYDPRPFLVLGVAPLIGHGADNGFPSDHSAVAGFVAAALWFIDKPCAILATLAAIAIGVARVYSLVHFPVDVAAGWMLGAIPAVSAMLLWQRWRG